MTTGADLVMLLRDTLALWGAPGRVAAEADGVTITGPSGEVLSVRAGAAPVRWMLTTPKRRRAIPSIGALLEAVRSALGLEPGAMARIGMGAGPAAHGAEVPSALPKGTGRKILPRSDDLTPVTLITGFLGSGKTTLVSRLLRSPALARTAVIVNEFGEIGLDHDLIERGDETLLQLTTGCLCCALQTDIARTLLDLDRRRTRGEIRFDRVLVETSGLADPAPILHAFMMDDAVGVSFSLGAVVTLIDAQLGEATLRAHPEARRQASLADLLVLSKTDLAPAPASLLTALREINQDAPITTGIDNAEALFAPRAPGAVPEGIARHTRNVTSIVIQRESPIPAAALALFIQVLAAQGSGRLLRVKGIVELTEMPGFPIILHGVQHVFSPPTPATHPSGAAPLTRIVVIGRSIPPYFPLRLLEAIVAEVDDEARLARTPGGYSDQTRVVSTPFVAAPISAVSDIGRP